MPIETTKPWWNRRVTEVVLVYAGVASTWIVLTDLVVNGWQLTTAAVEEMLKGLFFVLTTSLLLAVLLGRVGRRMRDRDRAAQRAEDLANLGTRIDAILLGGGTLADALDVVCAGVVELTGCGAWIGAREDDGRIRVIATAGRGLEDIGALEMRWDHGERAAGPAAEAIRTGEQRHRTMDDPAMAAWRDEARARGIFALAAHPLVTAGHVVGVMEVVSADRSSLQPDTQRALEVLASRVTVAFDHAAAETALRRTAAAATAAANAIFITDTAKDICWVNDAFVTLTGYEREEVLGRNPRLLASGLTPPEVYRDLHRTIDAGRPWRGEILDRSKAGEVYLVRQTITPVRDADGTVTEYIAINEDLSEKRQVQERLVHLATHDEITGLPNRMLLMDRLARAMRRSRVTRVPLGLIAIGLDGFTEVNESHGVGIGDHVLAVMARRFRDVAHPDDTVARLGNDEFCVLVEGMERPAEAAVLGEELLAAARDPIELRDEQTYLSASGGVIVYPDDDGVDGSAEVILAHAVTAMRRAKASGRDRLAFHRPQHAEEAADTLRLRNRLHRAITGGELVLHYQPQVSLHTGKTVGAEALVRWQPPGGPMVMPGVFIPIAEDSGMVVPLTDWVVREAAEACVRIRATQPDFVVSVNVSPVHLHAGGVADLFADVLRDVGLPPAALEVELTENALFPGGEAEEETAALIALGLRLSIDDFGTGFSSIGRVRDMPVSALKIDRSFVTGLPAAADNVTIVQAVIALAHKLGMEVVAEGIETPAELAFLAGADCDVGQGYLLGRPVPEDRLRVWLSESHGLPTGVAAT